MGGLQMAFFRVSSEDSEGVLVAFHLFLCVIFVRHCASNNAGKSGKK
jgi:hypothetical protein